MFERVLTDLKRGLLHRDPTIALVSFSVICNFLMTVCKIMFGVYLGSGWLITNSIYFLALGLMRFYVLRRYIAAKSLDDYEEKYSFGYEVHKLGGNLIVLLAMTYLLCCFHMYFVGDAITVGGKLVYCLIVFTLIKFVISIYGMVITRHRENLIVRLLKVLGIIDAFISIVPTTYAFLSMMNNGYSADVSSGIGMIISMGVVISGIVMVKRKYAYDSVAHLIGDDKLIRDYINKFFSSRHS